MSNATVAIARVVEQTTNLTSSLDIFFLFFVSILVFFIHAGFLLIQSANVRVGIKNIVLKKFFELSSSGILWWAIGYSFSSGVNGNSFIGWDYRLLFSVPDQQALRFLFGMIRAQITGTIVFGSITERINFSSYILYHGLISVILYPTVYYWTSSDRGFLSITAPSSNKIFSGGVIDFAGCTAVHLVSGIAAIAGSWRIRASSKSAIPLEQQGFSSVSSLGNLLDDMELEKGQVWTKLQFVFRMLGVLLLFIGWLGLNGGSVYSISSPENVNVIGRVIVNTVISSFLSVVSSVVVMKVFFGKYNIIVLLNSSLFGLVSVSASCAVIDNWAAAVIGILGGPIFFVCTRFLQFLRIDDPAEIVSVHFFGGIYGMLVAGLFTRDEAFRQAFPSQSAVSIGHQLGYQITAIILVSLFVFLVCIVYLSILKMLSRDGSLVETYEDRSLFDEHPEDIMRIKAPAPEGQIAIAFTDVQGSTALWETDSKMMTDAIDIHHRVIRELIRVHNGYEVKTEGDAFMVAFQDAQTACEWALDVQAALVHAEWPKPLYQLRYGEIIEDFEGSVIYRGLRVRMGIHYGDVSLKIDECTSRADYYGITINRGARVSGTADGGQIHISREVVDQISRCEETGYLELNHPHVCHRLGLMPLKGVRERMEIYELMPFSLRRRVERIIWDIDYEESISADVINEFEEEAKIAEEKIIQFYVDEGRSIRSLKDRKVAFALIGRSLSKNGSKLVTPSSACLRQLVKRPDSFTAKKENKNSDWTNRRMSLDPRMITTTSAEDTNSSILRYAATYRSDPLPPMPNSLATNRKVRFSPSISVSEQEDPSGKPFPKRKSDQKTISQDSNSGRNRAHEIEEEYNGIMDVESYHSDQISSPSPNSRGTTSQLPLRASEKAHQESSSRPFRVQFNLTKSACPEISSPTNLSGQSSDSMNTSRHDFRQVERRSSKSALQLIDCGIGTGNARLNRLIGMDEDEAENLIRHEMPYKPSRANNMGSIENEEDYSLADDASDYANSYHSYEYERASRMMSLSSFRKKHQAVRESHKGHLAFASAFSTIPAGEPYLVKLGSEVLSQSDNTDNIDPESPAYEIDDDLREGTSLPRQFSHDMQYRGPSVP